MPRCSAVSLKLKRLDVQSLLRSAAEMTKPEENMQSTLRMPSARECVAKFHQVNVKAPSLSSAGGIVLPFQEGWGCLVRALEGQSDLV